MSRKMGKMSYSQNHLTLFLSLDHLEKKRHSSKKKLTAIIVSSALLVMGVTIVALVSYIWKKKLKNQGMFLRKLTIIIIDS
jgi:hypothetical protein